MTLTDKTVKCRECQEEFVFTVGEQEFYAERGFLNQETGEIQEPKKCKPCRDAAKQNRNAA